jgi:hypothetical protein
MSALKKQVGGNHYRNRGIQPAEFCHSNNVPKLEGDAIYYVLRWREKGGLQDLRKAIHTIEILIDLEQKAGRKK